MNQQTQNRVGSIQLPQYLFQNLSSIQNNITGLVFTIYINSSLFPIANISQDRSIRSPVVGALVAGQNPVEDLTNPVLIDLTLSHNNDVRKQLKNMTSNIKYSFTFCCIGWGFHKCSMCKLGFQCSRYRYIMVAHTYLIKFKILQEVMATGQTEAVRQYLLLVQIQCSVIVHIWPTLLPLLYVCMSIK